MCHTWTVSFFNKLRYLYFTTHKKNSDSIVFLYLIKMFTKLFDYKLFFIFLLFINLQCKNVFFTGEKKL